MEKQKRFNIQRKISYEEEISEENKKVIEKGFACGVLAIYAVIQLYRGFSGDNYQIFTLIAGGSSATLGYFNLYDLIKAIKRKTMLKGEIKAIDAELEMCEGTTEKEENRGIRK